MSGSTSTPIDVIAPAPTTTIPQIGPAVGQIGPGPAMVPPINPVYPPSVIGVLRSNSTMRFIFGGKNLPNSGAPKWNGKLELSHKDFSWIDTAGQNVSGINGLGQPETPVTIPGIYNSSDTNSIGTSSIFPKLDTTTS